MIQLVLAGAGVVSALGGIAGLTALIRVFVIDRRVVKRDDLQTEREYSQRLRVDLEAEIVARRDDRERADEEILKLRREMSTLRDNWDACRAECQRLRGVVERLQGGAA